MGTDVPCFRITIQPSNRLTLVPNRWPSTGGDSTGPLSSDGSGNVTGSGSSLAWKPSCGSRTIAHPRKPRQGGLKMSGASCHRLQGLEPDNLLAFLALLGL